MASIIIRDNSSHAELASYLDATPAHVITFHIDGSRSHAQEALQSAIRECTSQQRSQWMCLQSQNMGFLYRSVHQKARLWFDSQFESQNDHVQFSIFRVNPNQNKTYMVGTIHADDGADTAALENAFQTFQDKKVAFVSGSGDGFNDSMLLRGHVMVFNPVLTYGMRLTSKDCKSPSEFGYVMPDGHERSPLEDKQWVTEPHWFLSITPLAQGGTIHKKSLEEFAPVQPNGFAKGLPLSVIPRIQPKGPPFKAIKAGETPVDIELTDDEWNDDQDRHLDIHRMEQFLPKNFQTLTEIVVKFGGSRQSRNAQANKKNIEALPRNRRPALAAVIFQPSVST